MLITFNVRQPSTNRAYNTIKTPRDIAILVISIVESRQREEKKPADRGPIISAIVTLDPFAQKRLRYHESSHFPRLRSEAEAMALICMKYWPLEIAILISYPRPLPLLLFRGLA